MVVVSNHDTSQWILNLLECHDVMLLDTVKYAVVIAKLGANLYQSDESGSVVINAMLNMAEHSEVEI